MAPSITTLSIKTLSIKTLSIKTLSVKKLSIKTLVKLGVHHSYAQIIFSGSFDFQGFSKRILLFG
jgi:hypothetical protein